MKVSNKDIVCAVAWLDASYVFSKKLPKHPPQPQITVGFLVEDMDSYLNIATNIRFDPKTKISWPIDGFIIPKKTILEFKKLVDMKNTLNVSKK